MNIKTTTSHLNGVEFLLIQKPELWRRIQTLIVDADSAQSLDRLFLENGWEQAPADSMQSNYLMKDRVALEFHNGRGAAPQFYAQHLAFYVGDRIDVGIEILPAKSLQRLASNIIRQGRGVPAVPLVLVGVGA